MQILKHLYDHMVLILIPLIGLFLIFFNKDENPGSSSHKNFKPPIDPFKLFNDMEKDRKKRKVTDRKRDVAETEQKCVTNAQSQDEFMKCLQKAVQRDAQKYCESIPEDKKNAAQKKCIDDVKKNIIKTPKEFMDCINRAEGMLM